MHPDKIFTAAEQKRMRAALDERRTPGAYRAGKWMVSAANPRYDTDPDALPSRVILRDIAMRTIEQMPGIVNSAEERLEFLKALVRAGVPEVATSCFRRGHELADMQAEVEAAKSISPECKLIYGNAVKEDEIALAASAGYDTVQIWNATFLGEAMPASAGAVYHRVWQGREWRDLNFPKSAQEHIGRARRLVGAGQRHGVQISAMLNLIAWADDDYIAQYCQAMADEGAHEVILTDSSGGCGPEAIAHLVKVARQAAPNLRLGVHMHNMFGLAVAGSIAGARAGAEVIELSVNGYEVGPGGVQASLAATAVALEAMYGVHTGIDLSQMDRLARFGAQLTGVPVPWNEPILGSAILETAGADEYEQEARFDPLIHGAVTAELVGAQRHSRIGATTGPLSMWEKLDELGLNVDKLHVEPILRLCWSAMREHRRSLEDEEIRAIVEKYLSAAEDSK